MNENEYDYLKTKIRTLIQIDLNNYDENQMMHRLDNFIFPEKAMDLIQYCARLETDPVELIELRSFIAINISEFYRDLMHFDTLRKTILPDLLKKNAKLNIWCAGCSDGQEPYMVAIFLNELTPKVKHRIFATDNDSASLRKAAAGGPYSLHEINKLGQQVLNKYFNLSGQGYFVNNRIREKIIFSQHDLTRDKFPIGFNLIICRDVTMYFSAEAKQILSLKFHSSLDDNGVLFIAATEAMLDACENGFKRLHPCFYKKNAPISVLEPMSFPAGMLRNRQFVRSTQ